MSYLLSGIVGLAIGWLLGGFYIQRSVRKLESLVAPNDTDTETDDIETALAPLTNPILVDLRRAEWSAMEAGVLRCTDADDVRLRISYWAPLVFADVVTQADVSFFIVRHRSRIYDTDIAMEEQQTATVN